MSTNALGHDFSVKLVKAVLFNLLLVSNMWRCPFLADRNGMLAEVNECPVRTTKTGVSRFLVFLLNACGDEYYVDHHL